MKILNKTMNLKVMVLSIVMVFFNSCDENASETESLTQETTEMPKYVYNTYVENLKLPDGTEVKKIDNSMVEFIYPKGVELWVFDQNGIINRMASTGSYTCTCSGSNGCDVFYVRGNFGCSHGECSGSCTGSHSRTANSEELKYEFVDTNQKLQPITNDRDYDEFPYISKMILHHNKIQNELNDYAFSIYGNQYKDVLNRIDNIKQLQSDVNDIIYIEMKIYGYKFIYGVSTNDLKSEILKNNNFERIAASHFCNCESGSSGCEKGSSLGVKYCEGKSCSECTMTVS